MWTQSVLVANCFPLLRRQSVCQKLFEADRNLLHGPHLFGDCQMTQQSWTLTHLSPNPGPGSRVRTRLSHTGRRRGPYSVLHRGFWTALSLSCHPGPVWLERPYQGQRSFWDHLDTQTSPPHKGGTSGGEWMHFFRWKTVTVYCTFGVDWVLSKTLTSGWDERRSLSVLSQ